ncbi:hypothetical protein ACFC4J_40250, partial [Streptomyces sp. NPDC056056]
TLKDKILGVCEILADPDVQTQQVLDILAAHGHEPSREHVQKTIAPWRKRRRAAEVAATAVHTAEVTAVHTPESEDFTPEAAPSVAQPAHLTSNDADRNETTADMPVFTPDMELAFEKDFAALQAALRETVSVGVNNGHHTGHTVNGTALHTRAGVADRPWQEFTPPADAHPGPVHTLPPLAPREFTPLDPRVHTSADEADTPSGPETTPDPTFATRVHTPGPAPDAQGSAPAAEVGNDDADRPAGKPVERSQAVYLCYIVALMTLGLGLNTSWRFFDKVLHISTQYGERAVIFTLAEVAMVVFGINMVASVRKTGKPGAFQPLVWGMCAGSAYMACAMSDDVREALGRVLFGPVLGTIALHAALGLEKRARDGAQVGTLARIGRELRERFLSRFGLADDARDAAQRTQDRAIYRAATLLMPRKMPWTRQARLERAIRAGKA